MSLLSQVLRRINVKIPSGAMTRLCSTESGDGSGGIIDPQDTSPPIPAYVEKIGEATEVKRNRLEYQSRKRGMLENGLLLSNFAGRYLKSMTEAQLTTYDKLINQPTNDWDIYYWVTGVREVPEEFQSDIMTLLQTYSQNEEGECRVTQPDLVY